MTQGVLRKALDVLRIFGSDGAAKDPPRSPAEAYGCLGTDCMTLGPAIQREQPWLGAMCTERRPKSDRLLLAVRGSGCPSCGSHGLRFQGALRARLAAGRLVGEEVASLRPGALHSFSIRLFFARVQSFAKWQQKTSGLHRKQIGSQAGLFVYFLHLNYFFSATARLLKRRSSMTIGSTLSTRRLESPGFQNERGNGEMLGQKLYRVF